MAWRNPSATPGRWSFGYDPLFYVADQRVTAAEMNSTLKNQLSHRGQARRRYSHNKTKSDTASALGYISTTHGA